MTLNGSNGALTEEAHLATPNLQAAVSFMVQYVHEKYATGGEVGWVHLYASYRFEYERQDAHSSVAWRDQQHNAVRRALLHNDEQSFDQIATRAVRSLGIVRWAPPPQLFAYCRRFVNDQTTLPKFRHSVGSNKAVALRFHDQFIFYDSRTAYALNQLVNAYYLESGVDNPAHVLRVEQMEYPTPANRASRKTRARRTTFTHGESARFDGNLGQQGWLGWFFSSYVCREICRRLNGNGSVYGIPDAVWSAHEPRWYCYHLDMALWTLGGLLSRRSDARDRRE